MERHGKANRFNAAIDPSKAPIGDVLTDAVEQNLRDHGFEVQVIHNLVRTPDDRFRWGSFDEAMSKIDEVRSAYATGAQLAAARLAEQISAAATESNNSRLEAR